MMNFFRKHIKVIFIVTVIAFLGGIFFGATSFLFSKSSDFVVKINGTRIPVNLFHSICASSVRSYEQAANRALGERELNEIKSEVIQALVQTEFLCHEAKKYGIIVTDEELKNDLQNSLEFKDGNTFSMQRYIAFLNVVQMKPKEYENLRRKQIEASKVKMLMASSIGLWNYEAESAKKQDPALSKNDLFFKKVNMILTEWYTGAIRNSKIIGNDPIFKSA